MKKMVKTLGIIAMVMLMTTTMAAQNSGDSSYQAITVSVVNPHQIVVSGLPPEYNGWRMDLSVFSGLYTVVSWSLVEETYIIVDGRVSLTLAESIPTSGRLGLEINVWEGNSFGIHYEILNWNPASGDTSEINYRQFVFVGHC